jgi:16S rRNA (adenine1518-N6/adenine1519-N6)-dimethyltransferase
LEITKQSLRDKISTRLNLLNQKAKKSLGQNFLVDQTIVNQIINEVKKYENLKWVEIGPGLGSLTDGLNENLKNNLVSLIELDSVFAKFWLEQGFNVVETDALKFNWSSVQKPMGLVSNLPYQISSRIVIEMSIQNIPDTMILMYQKEVADRILSLKMQSSYGFLSVVAQNFWDIKKLVFVSPNCFNPRPKVDSQVLTFQAKESHIQSRAKFTQFVKECFLERRKKISNKAKKMNKLPEFKLFFEQNNLSLDMRAEELSPTQFRDLYLFIEQNQDKTAL